MLIRILYILFLCSFLTSQSFFNRFIGEDNQLGDARATALANTNTTSGETGLITSKNPARLSYLSNTKKGIILNTQLQYRMFLERRSVPYYDQFDELLAYTDYVQNRQSNSYGSFGFSVNQSISNDSKLGIGISMMPLSSFNYNYEEEVRAEESFDDGVIGTKDPILGYHIYENKGNIDVFSIGLGYSTKINSESQISFGIAVNHILNSEVSDYVKIDTVFQTEFNEEVFEDFEEYEDYLETIYSNFSDIEPIKSKNKTTSAKYETFSIEFPLSIYSPKSSIIFAVENDAFIRSSIYPDIDEWISIISGLPSILEEHNGPYTWAYIFNQFGFEYYKPRKMTFGLRLDKNRTLLVFENTREDYSNVISSIFNDINEFKIGFEYRFRIGIPIRMGLSYKEPIFNRFGPITKFSLGSAKGFFNNKLNVGFALSYYITDYLYEDIFPVQSFSDNCSISCEKITESNMSLMTTLKWSF
tara:strand:- start:592 stop:2010 length:1419 start_codon:yes stop_codon:yes gene_type:complete